MNRKWNLELKAGTLVRKIEQLDVIDKYDLFDSFMRSELTDFTCIDDGNDCKFFRDWEELGSDIKLLLDE